MIRHFIIPDLGKMAEKQIDGATDSLSIPPGKTGTIHIEHDARDSIRASDFTCQPQELLTFKTASISSTRTALTMTAAAPGSSALAWVKTKSVGPDFKVWVGPYAAHYGSKSIDWLAVASNSDIRKAYAIQRILHNDDDCVVSQSGGPYAGLVKQNGGRILNCGDVCLAVGNLLFGAKTTYEKYFSYHRPISSKKDVIGWEDVTFAPDSAKRQQAAIERELRRGAVRVGLVYEPKVEMLSNGFVQPERGGGHFVIIVASNGAGNFLYLDPFPEFSMANYEGGVHWNAGKSCTYMGEFSVVDDNGGKYYMGTGGKKVIVAGPAL